MDHRASRHDPGGREVTYRLFLALSGRQTTTLARFLVASLLATTTAAFADAIPYCGPPSGVGVASFATAPPVLLRALHERLGEIVAPGEAFDATDLVETGRNRRFIFIWNVGNRWIVATEHGGLGYDDPILAYDLDQDGRSATLVEERIAAPYTVCPTALILLEVGRSKP